MSAWVGTNRHMPDGTTTLTHLEAMRSSDQTKSSCLWVRGRVRSRVTWEEGGAVTRVRGGWGRWGQGGLPLAWPGGSAGRTHTCTSSSEGSGSSGCSVRRPPGGNGRGAVATGSWRQAQVLRALAPLEQPCPAPHPTWPADLGLTHASELLWRGEYRPAEALPLAVGATEPVVQVQRDVHQPCGVGHWGRASPGRLPPGPTPPDNPAPLPPRDPYSPGPGGTPCRRRVKGTLRLAWARVSSLT